jgi:phosphinothricin acetyltransferase
LNFHVLIGGISLPNDASIALHEKFGFEKVAHFKEVGFKFNRWIDVGYWQLTIPNTPIKKISTY